MTSFSGPASGSAIRRFAIVLVAGVWCAALPASAAAGQQPAAPGDQRVIAQLLERIEKREQQVQELQRRSGPPEPAAAAPAAATEHAMPAGTSLDLPQSSAVETYPNLQLRGFADVNFQADDAGSGHDTFTLGQLDLYFTSTLSSKVNFFSEVVAEAGLNNVFEIDVERILLQYQVSDYLQVSAGRYHTAIGYYNTASHHGTWLQTTIGRPLIFQFEDAGGILPMHGVGVTFGGAIPSGALGLHYFGEISNGRPARLGTNSVQNTIDENRGKAVNAGVFARPSRFPGTQFGLSVYRDRLTRPGLPRFGETILAGHAVYRNDTVELLTEGVLVRHTPDGGSTLSTTGGYGQFARRFDKVWPYARYDFVDAAADDPFTAAAGVRSGPTLGLRYDFSDLAALKGEYRRIEQRQLSDVNQFRCQLTFTF